MVHMFCRYPYRNECFQHTFFTYYFCDAVGKTWSAPWLAVTLLSISSLKCELVLPTPPPPLPPPTHTHRQSLYDNEQQVQDHFTMFWEQVARRFKANPCVLGGPLLPSPSSLPPSSLPPPPSPLPSSSSLDSPFCSCRLWATEWAMGRRHLHSFRPAGATYVCYHYTFVHVLLSVSNFSTFKKSCTHLISKHCCLIHNPTNFILM